METLHLDHLKKLELFHVHLESLCIISKMIGYVTDVFKSTLTAVLLDVTFARQDQTPTDTSTHTSLMDPIFVVRP